MDRCRRVRLFRGAIRFREIVAEARRARRVVVPITLAAALDAVEEAAEDAPPTLVPLEAVEAALLDLEAAEAAVKEAEADLEAAKANLEAIKAASAAVRAAPLFKV